MNSFVEKFDNVDWNQSTIEINSVDRCSIEKAINGKGGGGLPDLVALLSPLAGREYLEEMAQMAHQLTLQRFGKVIPLFAPIYLSKECNNVCDYCGFSMGNQIPRKTLSMAEILREIGVLKKNKFEHILLVTGESSKRVGVDYLYDSIKLLEQYFSNVSMEVQPLREDEYAHLIGAGLHAVLVYK